MKELTLEITNYCTGFCSWCSSNSVYGHGSTKLSYQKVFKLLDKYCLEGFDVVRISGGEPTSHPHIVAILNHAKIRGYYVVLLTNGSGGIKRVIEANSVDEYVVNVVEDYSLKTVEVLRYLKKNVSLHVVLVENNEKWILKAIEYSLENKIPLRLLTLQKQGKAKLNPLIYKPLTLLSWTGDKGCNKDNKVTITHDGKVVTCSALKYKDTCDLLGGDNE